MSMQMTCPFCKKEFPYENDEIDRRLHEIGIKIEETKAQLQRYKIMPKYQKTNETWKEKQFYINQLNRLNLEYRELKDFRRQGEFQKGNLEYRAFKSFVKELIGDKKYMELWDKVHEEMKAYDISDLMKKYYSRSSSKPNVTSINKI